MKQPASSRGKLPADLFLRRRCFGGVRGHPSKAGVCYLARTRRSGEAGVKGRPGKAGLRYLWTCFTGRRHPDEAGDLDVATSEVWGGCSVPQTWKRQPGEAGVRTRSGEAGESYLWTRVARSRTSGETGVTGHPGKAGLRYFNMFHREEAPW